MINLLLSFSLVQHYSAPSSLHGNYRDQTSAPCEDVAFKIVSHVQFHLHHDFAHRPRSPPTHQANLPVLLLLPLITCFPYPQFLHVLDYPFFRAYLQCPQFRCSLSISLLCACCRSQFLSLHDSHSHGSLSFFLSWTPGTFRYVIM